MLKTILHDLRLGWFALVSFSAVTGSIPALAQQKTGPGLTDR